MREGLVANNDNNKGLRSRNSMQACQRSSRTCGISFKGLVLSESELQRLPSIWTTLYRGLISGGTAFLGAAPRDCRGIDHRVGRVHDFTAVPQMVLFPYHMQKSQ